MTVQELLDSKRPYIKIDDQYIVTSKLPDPKCKCKGLGYYGLLAPKGQAKKHYDIPPNSKCQCGSNLKYKKCCQSKMDRLEKSGAHILSCYCIGRGELVENNFVKEIFEETKEQWQKTTTGPISTEKTDQQ